MSTAAAAIPAGTMAPTRAPWKAMVAEYAQPRLARTWLDIATSVVPYLALLVAMYLLLDISVLLSLALAPLAAGFLLRSFILFHDCTHGSLFKSKRANHWLGIALGLLVYTPFESWGHSHAIHHATAGDLDRRGVGDVSTLTVAEYNARTPRARLAYRLFRNPLVMFGLGPILSVVVLPRLVPKDARPRLRRAIIRTNICVVAIVVGLCLLMGWWQYLVVQWPAAWMAASAGIFLFYVQHQFEDVYWEKNENWEYADAAIRGSSFLKLPRILQYFTGNIGFHHVHHLSARIPNYNLQRAHEDIDLFRDVPTLTIKDGLRATRLKLWDEDQGRLVTWAEAHAAA
ncbi:MAG: fatty acid desaturase [Solirubrobacteraceae bacterium]|nr:fatty acid desaturase [Solirubrobacteraceae bacterium]